MSNKMHVRKISNQAENVLKYNKCRQIDVLQKLYKKHGNFKYKKALHILNTKYNCQPTYPYMHKNDTKTQPDFLE